MRNDIKPPRRTKVLGRPLKVDLVQHLIVDDDEVLGVTHSDDQLIVVSTAQGPDSMRETYLHEQLHAMIHATGMQRDILEDLDEQVVKRLTPILLLFLQQNPAVYTYLTGRYTYR